jgi:hypothetical protein
MRTLRCECGEAIMWTTDSPFDCQGCMKCNTTYAGHPDGHKPLQPHTWKIMYDQNTGKPYKRCNKCGAVDEESYKESHKISDDIFDEHGNVKGAKTYDSPAVINNDDLVIELPPDDNIDDDGKIIDGPSLDELPIPEDLNEAIEVLTNDENIKSAWEYTEDEFLGFTHHGFGTGLRNGWGLWRRESILTKWFNEKGIYHADDMSGIILTSFHRSANNIPIDLEGQIKQYREYWDKVDPNVNKGII